MISGSIGGPRHRGISAVSCCRTARPPMIATPLVKYDVFDRSYPPPPPVLPHPRENGPPPPPGGRPPPPRELHCHHTHTFSGTETALQNERIQWQDCDAFTLIRDAAMCITVLGIPNDLRQNRFPCGVDEHYIHPRGKPGCAVKFLSAKMSKNVLPRVQGIQVAVPNNTVTHTTTQ